MVKKDEKLEFDRGDEYPVGARVKWSERTGGFGSYEVQGAVVRGTATKLVIKSDRGPEITKHRSKYGVFGVQLLSTRELAYERWKSEEPDTEYLHVSYGFDKYDCVDERDLRPRMYDRLPSGVAAADAFDAIAEEAGTLAAWIRRRPK
jgi:hypothetical protein